MTQDEIAYPWGQDWSLVGTSEEERFARLQHRGTETGFDPTLYRMYSSAQGRWLSPDPVQGCVMNPQGLDLYAYSPTRRSTPSTWPLPYSFMPRRRCSRFGPGSTCYAKSLEGDEPPGS